METTFNNVPVGLFRTTLDGRLLQANPTLAVLLGCPDVPALLASNVTDFCAKPADRTRLLDLLDRHGATAVIEALFRRRDGSTLWVEIGARRVDDGAEPFVIGAIADISTRKQSEAETERFARAAAASGEVIFMTDAAGVFTYVNPEFTRVYGYEAAEVIGRHTPRLLKSGLHDDVEYQAFWRDLLAGRGFRGEFRNRRKDGSVVLIDASANPVNDSTGAITGFLAIQRDITQRRETENALRESEALFRRIFDQLPVGAALLSKDRRFHRANSAFCRMVGRTEAELRELTFLDITHPEDRERSAEIVKNLIAGRLDLIELTKRYVRKDGADVWGAVSVRLITDANSQPLWTMPVVVDVTEQRRLEHQLRQAQKMEAIGQLAGGIAHDFNNMLTAITGYSEMILEQIGPDKPLYADLLEIKNAADRAAALTRQLLAFSRQQVLRVGPVNLNTVVTDVLRLLARTLGEQIIVDTALAPDLRIVVADSVQLEQVLMNLAVNARDAMPNGGNLTITTENVEVDEPYAATHAPMPTGSYVRFVVSDTGSGMTADVLTHVFEPFFTTKGPGKGTGLGLATVYGIVKQLGGFIWASSVPGRGSTFEAFFPAATRTAGAGEHVPQTAPVQIGSETLLVCEDDPGVRALACSVLKRHGYRVLEARSGAEALAQAAVAPHVDLLLTDVVMPHMTGVQLARQLASRSPKLKVLYMSGYSEHGITHSGVLNEGVDLIEKPFGPKALLARVRQRLDS